MESVMDIQIKTRKIGSMVINCVKMSKMVGIKNKAKLIMYYTIWFYECKENKPLESDVHETLMK